MSVTLRGTIRIRNEEVTALRLCLLSSLLPDGEPTTGYEIANQAILDGYRRIGAEVTVAGFRRPGSLPAPDDAIDLGEIPIENSSAGAFRKAAWVATALSRHLPVAATKVAGLERAELERRLRSKGPFDGLILNSIQMPAAHAWLQDEWPTIFIAHNVEALSARQNASNARPLHTRLLYRREARLLEAAETRVCRKAAVVHTLSEADRVGLGLGGAVKAIPLALSLGRSAASLDGPSEYDVGLIGTWSWAPNRVGLDWFVREVAPRLPEALRIGVAGRFDGNPPPAPPNVAFVGRVPDAQAFVRSCRVMALATKGGTGVQLKTVETFEEGMPAVATPEALRGVEYLPANVVVASDPADFAAALARIVAQDCSGARVRLDGRQFAGRQRAALENGLARGLEMFARTPAGATEESTASDLTTPGDAVVANAAVPPCGRLEIGGVAVHDLSTEAAISEISGALAARRLTRLAFLNAHCVNLARARPDYRAALSRFLVLPDGIGVDIGARILHGRAFRENLNGTDFVPRLCRALPGRLTVALIGGEPGIAQIAAERLAGQAPQHQFVAVSDGYFSKDGEKDVLERLARAEADIVLVALGVPAQELFIADALEARHGTVFAGVGALFDFLAGKVTRAPPWARRLRVEWIYRLWLEPGRLWRRYILGNPRFLLGVLRDRFGGR